MTYEQATRALAFIAILPAAATGYFVVFWRWFDIWRKHQVVALAMMIGSIVALGVGVYAFRDRVFAVELQTPSWVHAVGWLLIVIANGFGWVADRQIGFRVRSFTPFFDEVGRLDLKTTGAYGVVRHPIYAAGIWFQVGVFLVSGTVAVAIAALVFGLGAVWFTRQEERRLVELLADPEEYARYRERVPGLIPWLRGRRRS